MTCLTVILLLLVLAACLGNGRATEDAYYQKSIRDQEEPPHEH